jgi:hypothetical protein
MITIDYIGFDIHKKTISFCAKAPEGTILEEGTIPSLRNQLLAWAKARSRPWIGGDGSDAVYRMDLRFSEAIGPGVRDLDILLLFAPGTTSPACEQSGRASSRARLWPLPVRPTAD